MDNYMENTSAIICCAGTGSRLGISTSKSLIDIGGVPLIIRLLEQLKDLKDIRIVVGYCADDVVKVVSNYRKDIMFVFNYNYESNGPAASVSKALDYCKENVLIIDGDTILKSNLNELLKSEENCIAYSDAVIKEPIHVNINKENMATKFYDEKKCYEWTGIAKIKRDDLAKRDDDVYKMIEPLMPLKAIKIEYMGIDTQDDYENAMKWF